MTGLSALQPLPNDQAIWQDRPVFVTGATGLLGTWLTRHLVALGADVAVLIRDWVPQSELVTDEVFSRIKIVRGDLQDQALMERILGEYEIDTVFHLAAQTIVSIANRNPISTFESNIAGTWYLLEAARRSDTVKQIIVASSDKAYGDQTTLPYTEDMPLQGQHPYDVSKSCADLITQSYAHTFGLPVVITRCGNLYGGGDLNWNRIIPGTIRSILRGEAPIIRSDGTYIRDYFYVEDAVYAYLLLAELFMVDRTLTGEAFNFSTELQITVLELVQTILSVMNSPLSPNIQNSVSNEILHQYLDATKAKRMLQWQPLFSLDDSLKVTVSWYQEFLGVLSHQ